MSLFEVPQPAGDRYSMREPCKKCGAIEGRRRDVNGQAVIRCAKCDTYAYSAPRTETGEAVRSVSKRPGIKPSTRARIIERARGRCEECGTEGPLQIGHLLSVKDGEEAGLTLRQLYAEANLYAVCEECNSGRSSRTVDPILWIAMMRRRLRPES